MYMLPVREKSLVFFFDHVHKVVGTTVITVMESRGLLPVVCIWWANGGREDLEICQWWEFLC